MTHILAAPSQSLPRRLWRLMCVPGVLTQRGSSCTCVASQLSSSPSRSSCSCSTPAFACLSRLHILFQPLHVWRQDSPHHAMCAASLLTPLRTLGIGVSQRVTLCKGPTQSPWPLALVTNQAVPKGSAVALVPETAMWGVSALVDLDDDGLVPDPVEMLSILGDRYPLLDTFYMAYFLACRAFHTHPGWHADRLRDILHTFPDIAAPNGLGETLQRQVALLARFSEDFVTPPVDTFLAAFYYTQSCSFQGRPDEGAASEGAGKENGDVSGSPLHKESRRRLTCAPLIDVVPRGAASNVVLRRLALNGQSLTEWATLHKVHGARQSLRGKDKGCSFWYVETTHDIPPSAPLVLPNDVFGLT